MTEPRERDETIGLYVGWDELQRRVSPGLGRDRFRALIKERVDHHGFPPYREAWGGFFWPKVKEWLDSDNEVGKHGEVTAAAEDGEENFDAAPKRKAGVQARPPRAAVLDRQAGEAGSHGLSGSVHRLTPRRG
jgi:hypothetical protein